MAALVHSFYLPDIAVSCGTIVLNARGQILLCHVTGTKYWDIPKGVRDAGESTFAAAKRELREETGLQPEDEGFAEIGEFDYQADKRLFLYRIRLEDGQTDLARLRCTSYFSDPDTGRSLPEMDDFRWAARDQVGGLCTLRMARCLLSLDW